MQAVHETDINFAAFCLAILKPITIEQAFKVIETGKNIGPSNVLDDKDTEDMIKIKDDGATWREIGEIYGIMDTTAFNRVKRYKKRIALASDS